MANRKSTLDRLLEKIELKQRPNMDACWIFTGTLNNWGYAKLRHMGRMAYAHRVSYELHVRPIDAGLTIDHLCRERSCVNPSHLEPVTNKENTLRGATITAAEARQSHCLQGHEFDLLNTRYYRGERRCRECHRQERRRSRARR